MRIAQPTREVASGAGGQLPPEDRPVLDELERTLAYARERAYTGWDYGDGMSSRLRRWLPVEHKWVNLAFQEAAKRGPVNLRPLLLVEQRRNPMGAALFAMANRTTGRLTARGRAPAGADYRDEARSLADWLLDYATDGYSGFCVGYPHPIQHLDGRGEPREPDIVNTSFAVEALLRLADLEPRYARTVESAANFATADLNYQPVTPGRGAVVDYHTKHPQAYYTINAGALCARMFLDLYAYFGDEDHRARAVELLDHIEDLQTDLGGWPYRDPPEASHLSMDTHHNGFIIEAFQRYRAVTGDDRFDGCLETALQFFRDRLFEADGAPHFDERHAYPRDVHASAQGVLVCTYAGDLAFARRILDWAIDHLSAGDGRFYTRRERFYTRRETLMRWCQAWQAFAMSEYLAARAAGDGG